MKNMRTLMFMLVLSGIAMSASDVGVKFDSSTIFISSFLAFQSDYFISFNVQDSVVLIHSDEQCQRDQIIDDTRDACQKILQQRVDDLVTNSSLLPIWNLVAAIHVEKKLRCNIGQEESVAFRRINAQAAAAIKK